jgi:hypothetical protein
MTFKKILFHVIRDIKEGEWNILPRHRDLNAVLHDYPILSWNIYLES